MSQRIPIIVANWKMNKLQSDLSIFVGPFSAAIQPLLAKHKCQVGLAPTALHLSQVVQLLKGTGILPVGQNSGVAASGAFTGEVSPTQLKDIGCSLVILGHSERRHIYLEDDELILKRLKAALKEGLSVIVCVGETLEERKSGNTFKTISRQLGILKEISKADFQRTVIAYEPVWAIGTGENATPDQAEEVHFQIRNWISKEIGVDVADAIRIQYGGSVKAENAKEIMSKPNVDGLLVGGASLDPVSFSKVIEQGINLS